MSDNNKIVPTDKLGPLKVGFSAKVDTARKQGNLATELFDCTKYPNRIVLCIDDSGSMSSSMEPVPGNSVERFAEPKDTRMSTCRKACEEFLNVCDSRDTALGMYTISTGREYPLTNLYIPLLGYIRELSATGGTPTIQTLDKIITKEKVSRVVLVSDGESGAMSIPNRWEVDPPNNKKHLTEIACQTLDKYKSFNIPIDTVYIGTQGDSGEAEMKTIAEYTNGLYMFFKSGESFRSKFKYLAPAFRGMLVSGEVKI